jgi:hypothetical protein
MATRTAASGTGTNREGWNLGQGAGFARYQNVAGLLYNKGSLSYSELELGCSSFGQRHLQTILAQYEAITTGGARIEAKARASGLVLEPHSRFSQVRPPFGWPTVQLAEQLATRPSGRSRALLAVPGTPGPGQRRRHREGDPVTTPG